MRKVQTFLPHSTQYGTAVHIMCMWEGFDCQPTACVSEKINFASDQSEEDGIGFP